MTATTSNRLRGERGLREDLVQHLSFRVGETEAQKGNLFTGLHYKLLVESGFIPRQLGC